MPTIQSMHLPMPQHWQEFESLVRDALANQWRSPSLQKNGRSGQEQHGVDIYGSDYLGRLVGVQCKRFDGQLKIKVVQEEIKNAETFTGQLSTLYIATTAEHDSNLQEQVRILSEHRAQQGKFAVGILFWDEIVAGLVLNPATVRAHYPNVLIHPTADINRERQLAALEFGYFGGDLWQYIVLIYGEFGWLAQADPDELIATLRIIEHRAQQLLSSEDAAPIIASLHLIRQGCLKKKKKESDWDPVQIQAKRASNRISKAASLLPMAEANALEVGVQLGHIYHHLDDAPKESAQTSIKNKVQRILGEASTSEVNEVFSNARHLNSGYSWAIRIYSLLNRELRYRL